MPSRTFTHSALAAAPVQVVWEALDRPGTWEAIPGVDRVFDPVIDAGGRLRGFSFQSDAGGQSYRGEASPAAREEGELMAWQIHTSEVRGTIRVDLRPTETGTSVTVTLEVESTGLVSSMFFPIIAGAIGNGLPRAVADFAAQLSSGA